MAFSPPEYCRLFAFKRRPTKRGSRAPQDPPPPLATPLKTHYFSHTHIIYLPPRFIKTLWIETLMNQLPQANKDIWKINIAITVTSFLLTLWNLSISFTYSYVRFEWYHRTGLNNPDNKKTIYCACFGSLIWTNFGFFPLLYRILCCPGVIGSWLPRLS